MTCEDFETERRRLAAAGGLRFSGARPPPLGVLLAITNAAIIHFAAYHSQTVIVVSNKPPHFPTFEIESVSLSTITTKNNNNNTINNINTAVWELGFSVGKLNGKKIKDLSVWARQRLGLRECDLLATVLTPQQTESKALDCGVMFTGGYSDYTLFTALCKNVYIEAETAGRWIMVGGSRLCPVTYHD
ncbi:CBL-interacting protein kinase 1 [Striga asiatica]|uniref:CBL-interacting protein kinase 1 n=1 Tax=Striga asiatica TaxID=4170 RepID=A0A5A7RB49_STRAF|nr:CBL-interacting protein kinase 1 [Striga asiatica]